MAALRHEPIWAGTYARLENVYEGTRGTHWCYLEPTGTTRNYLELTGTNWNQTQKGSEH